MVTNMVNDPFLKDIGGNNDNIDDLKVNIDTIKNNLPPNLEYLPLDTTFLLYNKRNKKLSGINIGDELLSLSINVLPTPKKKKQRQRADTNVLDEKHFESFKSNKYNNPRPSLPTHIYNNKNSILIKPSQTDIVRTPQSNESRNKYNNNSKRQNSSYWNISFANFNIFGGSNSNNGSPSKVNNIPKKSVKWNLNTNNNNDNNLKRHTQPANFTNISTNINKNGIIRSKSSIVRRQSETQLNIKKVKQKANSLEKIMIKAIYETKVTQISKIFLENGKTIKCTSTHLFWIAGKGIYLIIYILLHAYIEYIIIIIIIIILGWGCIDSKTRELLQKQIIQKNQMELLHQTQQNGTKNGHRNGHRNSHRNSHRNNGHNNGYIPQKKRGHTTSNINKQLLLQSKNNHNNPSISSSNMHNDNPSNPNYKIYPLKIGAKLLNSKGEKIKIINIENIKYNSPGINVYSVVVNRINTFFVNDFLAKNSI